jgi:ribosomal protein L21E
MDDRERPVDDIRIDDIHLLIKCLEETLSFARTLVPPDTHRGEMRWAGGGHMSFARTLVPREMRGAGGGHMDNMEVASAAGDELQVGSRVAIAWDRDWRWNRPKKNMPKTKYQGRHGTVVRTSKCYVWVKVDDTGEELQKRKHNVTLLG